MGEALKILGQDSPTANVLTNLYTVPSSFSAVVSSITICNQNSVSTINFSVSIAPNGAADAVEQYLYFNLPLLPNDTFIATIGISLGMNDVVRVKSDTANVSFNLLGVEVGAFLPPPANLAGGDLDGYYPNPTVRALQGNAVFPDILSSSEDGYVLTWDNTDGYWRAAPDTDIGGGSAVVFNGGSPSENLVSTRATVQSPITNTFEGIVNLSSKTSGFGGGANANFVTITGGDQNEIDADYGTISGGANNTISAGTSATISGGISNTVINGNFSTISGGSGNNTNAVGATVVGGQNCLSSNFSVTGGDTCSANSTASVAFGSNTTASGNASTALGYHTHAARNGQFAFSSSAGNVTSGVGSSATGDAQNGNMVYSAKQPAAGASTTFQVTDGISGAEFGLTSDFYYSISIRIIAYASNAAVGPINYLWEVGAYVVAGVATLAGTPVQLIPTLNDPNTTTWTTSITVSGTDNILHINVNSGTDATSIINAVADIRWVEIKAFAQ